MIHTAKFFVSTSMWSWKSVTWESSQLLGSQVSYLIVKSVTW